MFINRVRELRWLEDRWDSGRAELILIYGRRRVGKTRLLREWARGKRMFYFVAEEVPERRLLERLSYDLAEFVSDELLWERPFDSWRQVFLIPVQGCAGLQAGLCAGQVPVRGFQQPWPPLNATGSLGHPSKQDTGVHSTLRKHRVICRGRPIVSKPTVRQVNWRYEAGAPQAS